MIVPTPLHRKGTLAERDHLAIGWSSGRKRLKSRLNDDDDYDDNDDDDVDDDDADDKL